MTEFIFFMHGDAKRDDTSFDWEPYLDLLSNHGALRGGSEIGNGVCVRRDGRAARLSHHIVGFIRVDTQNLAEAQKLLVGNPVFEAGGTVEIRELSNND